MDDEIEIEVFRADTRASRGISSEDIAALAEFDCEANPVPVVIGHPKSDSPAEGKVKAFRADGNKLFATLKGLSTKLVDGIRDNSILNRSMAFFGGDHEANPTPGKLAPRHLGFLGGSAPGIPGMTNLSKAFSFNAEDELEVGEAPAEAIIFTAAPTPVRTIYEEPEVMADEPKTDDEKAKEFAAREAAIAAEEKRLEDERNEFAARAEKARTDANAARVKRLVNAGTVLPANSAALEMVFNALDDGELEFAADDKGIPADKLESILSAGPKLVDASGEAISPKGEKTFAATGNAQDDAKALDAAARELMKKEPTLNFEAALERVTNEKEG